MKRALRVRLGLEWLEGRALPTTLTVTNLNDSGPGTLRAEIAAANPGDTINFSVSGTIVLTGGTLSIDKNSTITGVGQTVTVDGNHAVEILRISAGVRAVLADLTIANADASHVIGGGGVENAGTLTVTGCTFNRNVAIVGGGGIDNQGTLTVTACTFSNNSSANGAGIANGGTLTVTACTFAANAAGFAGGGIASFGGTLTVTASTFANNSAQTFGGGISLRAFSEGAATLTMTACTLKGNRANASTTGGSFSGGGLALSGSPSTLGGTIVAGNFNGLTGTAPDDISGGTRGLDVAHSGNNLIGAGGAGGLVNGANGNQVGVGDPGLAPLGDYGGPTQTLPLLPGSPALAHGITFSTPTTDQRGVARPLGTAADVGAFQVQGYALLVSRGGGQTAPVDMPFVNRLVVTLSEAGGRALPGATVTFSAPVGGASAILSSMTAVTDALGRAGVAATADSIAGTYTVTATVGGLSASFALTNSPVGPTVPTVRYVAVGAGPGSLPVVHVYTPAGVLVASFFAFDPRFSGGVSVAVADLDGDGVEDIIVGAGPGGGPHVKVVDGTRLGQVRADGVIADTALVTGFFAYDPAFRGGVSVAGFAAVPGRPAELVTGAGPGGGPHVKVLDETKLGQVLADGRISDAALLGSFLAYDPGFTGGVTVAVADVAGQGTPDIVTGTGPGGGPHVKVIDGTRLTQTAGNGQILDGALRASFMAFDPGFTGGVNVAAGGGELVVGSGPGGSHVKVVDDTKLGQVAADGRIAGAALFGNFLAFSGSAGVTVALTDLAGTGPGDVVLGPGPGGGTRLKVVGRFNLGQVLGGGLIADSALIADLSAFDPAFPGGLLVG